MSADPDRLPHPPPPAPDWALLLDVDGTLLDFAPHPEEVRVPVGLVEDLGRLHAALGGAVGLVSGRRLEFLDALFAPLQLPAIGLHGLQRRDAVLSSHAPPHDWALVCDGARALCTKFPGALVEDKGITLALHWRNAPAAEEPLREFANSMLIQLPGYRVQAGHDVVELRPDGHDKGDAIVAMLDSPAFHGRFPVFVGDDLTDEHAFDAINLRHGLSVRVGRREPTAARCGLHDPAHVRDWLARGATVLAGAAPPRQATSSADTEALQ